MMPHTVPNSPTNGVTAAVIASHGTLRSSRVISSDAPICMPRWIDTQIPHRPRVCGLPLVFLISALENADQRTGLELVRDGSDILQALRLAERAHEASALRARPPQQTPFGQDDRPGDQAERQQRKQDQLGDRASVGNHVDDFAADEHC